MTDRELKELKDNLWYSADMLRASAHLAANKYGQPILGLIFLRYKEMFKQPEIFVRTADGIKAIKMPEPPEKKHRISHKM